MVEDDNKAEALGGEVRRRLHHFRVTVLDTHKFSFEKKHPTVARRVFLKKDSRDVFFEDNFLLFSCFTSIAKFCA